VSTTTPEGNISYSYDCGGKLGSVTKGTESTSYTYDGSLLLTDTRTTVNAVIDYTYDTDMRVGSIGYAWGVDSFLYDNDGLLTNAGPFTITRNVANGLPEAVSDGTVVQGRVFSGYGEVDSVGYSVGAAAPYSWSVTRDNAGRITQKVENIGIDTVTWDYTYDLIGRLETVYKDSLLAEAYSYDDNGNRLSENNILRGISRSYTHSVEDHVLTAGADTYAFDVDGFLTSRTIASGAHSGTATFDYSSRGELLSVTLPNTDVITYDHDPLGRRVAKRVNGVIVEKYLWQDATTLLAVYDGADALIQRFSYADGRMPVSMVYNAATYYLTYDQVGSLRAVTDSTGAIVKRIDYDSFGNILTDSNPAFTVPFGFAGGLHDRDTGLVRFGARDYDPAIGRWTAKDPIDFAGGDLNLYGYVLGDPVNGVDISGLIPFTNIYVFVEKHLAPLVVAGAAVVVGGVMIYAGVSVTASTGGAAAPLGVGLSTAGVGIIGFGINTYLNYINFLADEMGIDTRIPTLSDLFPILPRYPQYNDVSTKEDLDFNNQCIGGGY